MYCFENDKRRNAIPTPSSVAASPHEQETRDLLDKGWSANAVHDHLVQRHGGQGVPSAKAIQRYRRAVGVGPGHIVPTDLIDAAMNGFRRKVNALREIDQAILIQKRRLVRLSLQEEMTGLTDRALTPSFKVYEACLKERFRIAGELGINQGPKPQQEPREPRTFDLGGMQIAEENIPDFFEVLQDHIQREDQRNQELKRENAELKRALQETEAKAGVSGHQNAFEASDSGHLTPDEEPAPPADGPHDESAAAPLAADESDVERRDDPNGEPAEEHNGPPPGPPVMVLEGGINAYIASLRARRRGFF